MGVSAAVKEEEARSHELKADDLHRELDGLHEMIYRRGGIRPVNAAIEELSKLLLLEVKLLDDPAYETPDGRRLSQVLDPSQIAESADLSDVKDAFRNVAALPEYAARLPGGGSQPIWPADEPLRISRADVVAEAVRILRTQLERGRLNGNYDLIGTAFDVFLRGRYDHSGGLGTHLTPHTVATHLARLCLTDLDLLSGPISGPRFGDPCCGTGRFLVAGLEELGLDPDDPRFAQFVDQGLFGADQSASAVAKTRINLLLLGIPHPNVFTVEDSILDPHVDALRGKLRLILTNPPFGDGKYDSPDGIERASALLEPLCNKRRIDPALAFLARCLELLADGGRLGIVLPDGLVDGPVLRQALTGSESVRLRDVCVEANISLPTATFALAGTVARTSALVVRKQGARRGQIFLARAEHVGYLKQGSLSVPDPDGDDLPEIAAAGAKALSDDLTARNGHVRFISRNPLAAVVRSEELTTLDPARVDPAAMQSRAVLRKSGVPFGDLLRPARRRQDGATDEVPFISVLHIDDLGSVSWHEAMEYSPLTPGLVANPDNLIFSLLNPRKLRATVVPGDIGRVFCSSEFGVFEPIGDPYEALVLLHHPMVRAQLEPLGRGTSSSRRRITPGDLLAVLAPRLPTDELTSLAADLRSALGALREASIHTAATYAAAAKLAHPT